MSEAYARDAQAPLALFDVEKEGSRRRNSLPAGLASHTEVQPATSTWSPGNYSGAAVTL